MQRDSANVRAKHKINFNFKGILFHKIIDFSRLYFVAAYCCIVSVLALMLLNKKAC